MTETSEIHAHLLDVRGMKCPLPVLRTQKTLEGMVSGALLEVQCTDPMSALDIPHLVQQRGDTLVSSVQNENMQTYLIRKA